MRLRSGTRPGAACGGGAACGPGTGCDSCEHREPDQPSRLVERMAQTKRKRQTKHRGNAAGVVESRGRTGRKPTAAEKSGKDGDVARAKEKRLDKADQPPTWKGAALRALIAAMALVLLSGLIL